MSHTQRMQFNTSEIYSVVNFYIRVKRIPDKNNETKNVNSFLYYFIHLSLSTKLFTFVSIRRCMIKN